MNKFIFIFLMMFISTLVGASQKIVVQLEWKYQFQFAGFIMAKELGYYDDVGLDVSLEEYTKHVDVADVVDGKIDYLVSNSLLLYNEDGLYDITLLGTYFQKSPLVFVVQPEIKKVEDLKGKKIVINDNERKNSSLSVLLKHFSINSTNTTFIKPNYDMADFIAKKVDAIAVFTSDELFELDEKGVPYRVIDPIEYGYTTTAINLFASYDKVIKNPQEVGHFLAATKKGWQYALHHIDEATTLIHDKYRNEKSIKALTYEARVTKNLMIESFYDIGEINSVNLIATYEQLVKLGNLKKNTFDLEMLSLESYRGKKHLYLSQEERKYLKRKKELTICVDPKWKPFEWIDDEGKYRGMGADYFDAFVSQVGISYKLYKTQDWAQSLDSLKNAKCDLLPMVSITKPRKKFLSFTDAYYKMPYVIATTLDKPFIEDISEELDKKFAVIRDSAVIDSVKKIYPDIQFVEVSTVAQGLSFVREKKVYGLINTTAVISQLMYEEGFIDIKIAGALPVGYQMAIGVRKDEPHLRDILQKAIKNFPLTKKETIEQRWLSIVVSQKKDYTLVYIVLALALILVSGFLYRQMLLKKLNKRLEELAHFDTLTKLPNRSLFYDRLHKTINKAEQDTKEFALFFIDLDRFKQINDSLGHHIGDEVLKIVSLRLSRILNKESTVARLGGDEFTIIMKTTNIEEDARSLVKRILEVCTQTISIAEETLYLSTSVGISLYPQDAQDANDLVKFADTAMYKAKEEGKNCYKFYSKEFTKSALEKVNLQNRLREAIKNDEFVLHYQAQIDAQNSSVIGAEALVRWVQSDGKIISPANFIPIAEETGLIVEIDQIVMKKGMQQLSFWMKQDIFSGTLSLNLAAKLLAQENFMEIVQENLKSYKIDAKKIEFEITESDIMAKPEEAIKKLNQLHKLGVKISVDDFGTGYSSLSYLKRFPIDKLKIDQSFVRDLPEDEEDCAIVKAIIALGESLSLTLLAEGVEEESQKAFLVENGCNVIQGYLYSKPLPADKFEKFIETFKTSV